MVLVNMKNGFLWKLVVGIVVFSIVNSHTSVFAMDNILGINYGQGYFYNKPYQEVNSSFVLPKDHPNWPFNPSASYADPTYAAYVAQQEVEYPDYNSAQRANQVAIPSYVDTADEFMTLLGQEYGSGDSRSRAGAAFIVYTMLGRTAPRNSNANSDITVSGADFSMLRELLDDTAKYTVRWHVQYVTSRSAGGDCVNSHSFSNSNGDFDVSFFNDSRCVEDREGIEVVNNATNATVYSMWRACANPIGSLMAPPAEWSIVPTVTTPLAYVQPGATITWTHTITNTGPSPSVDRDIHYTYSDSDSSGRLVGSVTPTSPLDRTFGVLLGPFTSHSSTSTSIAPSSGTVCRVTIAAPKNSLDTSSVQSQPACVTVSAMSSNPCRPIKVPVSTHSKEEPEGSITQTRIEVNAINLYDGANLSFGNYYNGFIDQSRITKDCTTGDRWQISQFAPRHGEVGTWRCRAWDMYRHCTYRAPDYDSHSVTSPIVGPCYDYVLASSVMDFSTYRAESTTSVNITSKVKSKSFTSLYHTKSKKTHWELTRITFAPSIPIVDSRYRVGTHAGDDDNDNISMLSPCAYYIPSPNAGVICNTVASGDAVFGKPNINDELGYIETLAYAGSTSSPDTELHNVLTKTERLDYPAGTKVCYAFSVKAKSSEGTGIDTYVAGDEWSHSSLYPSSSTTNGSCVIIVKKPKVQVLGSDLITNEGKVATITSIKDNKYYGSWVEYGILPNHSIVGMASGSGFNISGGVDDDVLVSSNRFINYSNLSFGNNSSCSSSPFIGCYRFLGISPVDQIEKSFPTTVTIPSTSSLSGTVDIDNLISGHSYDANDGTTIVSTTNISNKWVVIKSTGTVTINTNIEYNDGPFSIGSEIPQLVIIAQGIKIADNVRRVDAWLISKGFISDCPTHETDKLTVSPGNNASCMQKLKINGPVMAETLYLRRTYGYPDVGAIDIKDPAEEINLRADAYLWAYSRAILDSSLETVYITEVAPRL